MAFKCFFKAIREVHVAEVLERQLSGGRVFRLEGWSFSAAMVSVEDQQVHLYDKHNIFDIVAMLIFI